mgnify:CR=1 FL=1
MFIPLFTASMSIVALYVYVRLILPLPLPVVLEVAMGIGVVLLANRVLIMRLFHATASDALLLVGSWLHAAVLMAALLCFVADVGFLAFGHPDIPPITFSGLVALGGLILAAYGVRSALRVPPVREMALAVPGLAPQLQGFRIAVLSDVHVGPLLRRRWVEKVVNRTLAANPDMIAVPGDLVDSPETVLAKDIVPLGRLRAPYGVFYSPGNHEYIYGVESWMRVFRRLGMKVLYNQHEVVDVNGATLTVAGLADQVGAIRPGATPDIDAALAGAPERDDFRLLLAHRPYDAAIHAARGVDLHLAGHTHGGQIWPLRPLTASANAGYAGGWYRVGEMRMFVSNGVGVWAGVPLRLGVPNHIVIIRLEADESTDTAAAVSAA